MPIQFLSANFDWSNLIAGFGGAAIGAFSAFFLSERQQRIKIAIENFEKIYKSATLAGITCKSAVDLKKQHIVPLSREYEDARSKVLHILGTPTVYKIIDSQFNLFMIKTHDDMAEEISQQLSTLALIDLKASFYVSNLTLNAGNLQMLLQDRNDWIKDFKDNRSDDPDKVKFARYFGYPIDKHSIDRTYQSIMHEIPIACDNVIMASYRLYRLLARHALDAHSIIPRKLRKHYSISFLDFGFEEDQEFFPNVPEAAVESGKRRMKKYVLETKEQYFDALVEHYIPRR